MPAFYEAPLFSIPGLSASEDLSAAQFKFVKMSGKATVGAVTGVTDKPVGVLQNTPGSGQDATVMGIGVSRMFVSGTISAGDLVGPHSDGSAKKLTSGTDTTAHICGAAIVGNNSTTSNLASVFINCGSINRAT